MKLVKQYRSAMNKVLPSSEEKDSALVNAAQLSNRYITNRFLADNAIVDELELRELHLDGEATALSQEKDEAIKQRLKQIAETEHRITEENKQNQDRLLTEVVGPNAIAEIVSRGTGNPVSKLSQTERDRLLKLSEHLHKKVIGQDGAVDSVAEAVLRSRPELSRQNQPIGSFLFLGPTGVGKTELAKTLAYELFDSTKSMIRIDMSE